jgi:hypothetical protein
MDNKLDKNEIRFNILDIMRYCYNNHLGKEEYIVRILKDLENTAEKAYLKSMSEKKADIKNIISDETKKLIDMYASSIPEYENKLYSKYNFNTEDTDFFKEIAQKKCDKQSQMFYLKYCDSLNAKRLASKTYYVAFVSMLAAVIAVIIMLWPLFH